MRVLIINIILILTLLSCRAQGYTLEISECNNNISNPYNMELRDKIININSLNDSIEFEIIFRSRCTKMKSLNVFDFKVNSNSNGTFFSYKLENDTNKIACTCQYILDIKIPISDIHNSDSIYLNKNLLDANSYNYNNFDYFIERNQQGEIIRIGYYRFGAICIEELYDNEQNLLKELFYEEYKGCLIK